MHLMHVAHDYSSERIVRHKAKPQVCFSGFWRTSEISRLCSSTAFLIDCFLTSKGSRKMAFPTQGKASTYSDYFKERRTASGEIYSHDKYTAALLPRSNWYVLPMGTLLKLTHNSKQVVVKINDRGAGKIDDKGINRDLGRVLDLSRIAMAALQGKSALSISDRNASVIHLQKIEIVPATTPLGPVVINP